MKGSKIVYVCRECGYTSIKWLGKCPDCACWDSFDEVEIRENNTAKRSVSEESRSEKFSELKLPTYLRSNTGMKELD